MGVMVGDVVLANRSPVDLGNALEASPVLEVAKEEGLVDFDLVFDVDDPTRGQLITRWPDADSAQRFAKKLKGHRSDRGAAAGEGEDIEFGEPKMMRSPEFLNKD